MPPPKPHPLLQATKSSTPAQYVLNVVATISSADLEEALLVLPFSHILKLITVVDEWFTRVRCRPRTAGIEAFPNSCRA